MVHNVTLAHGDEDTPVLYEELAEVEKKFEDVDIWLSEFANSLIAMRLKCQGYPATISLRQNYILTKPIYAKRAQLIERIPNFWAIVVEEAPEDIDHRIQPCDTAVLSTLQSIEVSRFEISESAPHTGDPRSLKITFAFGENAWFTDRILVKSFWQRRARDGWTGLVSEPVQICWKKGKDLTEGLLNDVVQIFELEKGMKKIQQPAGSDLPSKWPEKRSNLHEQLVQKLIRKLEETPQDALSFFAWFGYRGGNVSAEESAEAIVKEKQKREQWNSQDGVLRNESRDGEKEDEVKENCFDYEIYPAGEDLAIAISEDMFPGAIKYFIQGLKEDQLDSDEEAELDSNRNNDSKESSDSDEPATKKQKTIV